LPFSDNCKDTLTISIERIYVPVIAPRSLIGVRRLESLENIQLLSSFEFVKPYFVYFYISAQRTPAYLASNPEVQAWSTVLQDFPDLPTTAFRSFTMSSNRLRRIAREIEETKADHLAKVILRTAQGKDDLTHLEGQFEGPPDTPYEGGKYIVDIRIPNDYPFRPPIMKFTTRLWHPNVSSQTVCCPPTSLQVCVLGEECLSR